MHANYDLLVTTPSGDRLKIFTHRRWTDMVVLPGRKLVRRAELAHMGFTDITDLPKWYEETREK